MKKFYFGFVLLSLFAAWFILGSGASAQTDKLIAGESDAVSPNLVISQFQAGSTASADDEFIEIFNLGPNPVDLNGYRVVYRSQNGTNDVGPMATWTTPTVVQPGQYYLIASASYTGSVGPNIVYNTAACACSLSVNQGGLAIRQGEMNTGTIIDAVGWGTTTNIFFEGTRTTAAGNNNSKERLQNGCQDTDNNANDFATRIPSAPRNTSSAQNLCSGSGTTLFAAMAANPTTVTPPGDTLLTVTVIPATTPPSTNITVVGNLADIGGAASQPFFDDGTNGDLTPGDNVFSFRATIPAGTSGGIHAATALAADGEGRTVPLSQSITVNAPLPNDDPLLFGNPSNATPDIANENNYLMIKPQYTLSYNRAKATPNWVAWRLDSTWIGTAPRQDDYRPDPALPAAWYHVQDNDYSGSGYDRGHMCPSGDRTRSVPDNSATFLMTNFVPQLAANNQGPWNDFENYLRTIVGLGSEIYIFSGGHGNAGTIAQGRIVVPAVTWKVVLILPNGSNDFEQVARSTRAFGIIVPNQPPVSQSSLWRQYRVTIDAVEYLTGYDFFSLIRRNTQEIIERKRDKQ